MLFNEDVVLERLNAYLADQTPLDQFDPESHRTRRWLGIAFTMDVLTVDFQQDFRLLANAQSPFVEIESRGHADRMTSTRFPVLPRAPTLEEAIKVYELLLHQDFSAGTPAHASTSKAVARRRDGAFYTPKDLAEECVRVACETYIESRFSIKSFCTQGALSKKEKYLILDALCSAKVVDPSCGVARFLVAYIHLVGMLATDWYGGEHAASYVNRVCANVWGFDIDPIALGLSRMAIASVVRSFSDSGMSFVPLLHHLVLGNLLVQPPLVVSNEDAINAVGIGTIYSSALARPACVEAGAFDIVLGNPPWEKIRLEDRDFLAHLHTSLKVGTIKGNRSKEIAELEVRAPKVFSYLERIRADIEAARHLIGSDPWFVNSAHGELNTCPLFVEIAAHLIKASNGVAALLVKTSTVTHYANRRLFRYLLDKKIISKVFEFSNRRRLFPIDSRERFALLVLAPRAESIVLGMNLVQPTDLRCYERQIVLSMQDLQLLNPDSGMLPMPQGPGLLELLRKIYKRNSVFSDVYRTAKFGRLVHLTMHASDISTVQLKGWLGVQEGKFIERYDGRYSTFDGVPKEKRHTARAAAIKIEESTKENPDVVPVSRYFISSEKWGKLSKNYTEAWSLFWRSTTSASNARTCIATILPHCPAIQSLQMAQFPGLPPAFLAVVLAVMNSKVFDFIVRNKLSGIDLTQAIIGQAAVPPLMRWNSPAVYQEVELPLGQHVSSRVATLLASDNRLSPFVQELNAEWHTGKSRMQLQSEIDDLVAIAYELAPEDRALIWAFMPSTKETDASDRLQSYEEESVKIYRSA